MSVFRMSKNKKSIVLLVLILVLSASGAVFSAGCGQDIQAIAVTTPPVVSLPPPAKARITLALVGDIMVHADQLAGAFDPNSGNYDFSGCFAEAAPYLKAADLAIGNLETTLAGPEAGFSGYPRFNSPRELVTALEEAGFDVLTNANNHSMDRKEQGVVKTIQNLDEAGMAHTGTFATPADSEKILLITRNGITTAVLAYTYGTNGILIPQGKEYLVNQLDLAKIEQDITAARNAGADIVVVYPHMGVEYRRTPGEAEVGMIEQIFQAGADIVAASHPHVLQPMRRNGGGESGPGLFNAYSLGNFISGQRGKYKDSGVIVLLTVEKDLASGTISLSDAKYIPTWVHKYREHGKTVFRVIGVEKAMRDYTEGTDKKLTPGDYKRLQEVWQETNSLITGEGAPSIQNI